MIVGACGFGSTGSSVISDYLLEFENTSVLDRLEFTWVSGVDGLVDLEYHLMHPHMRTNDSIVAIDRYIKRMKREERLFIKSGLVPKQKYEKSTYDFINSITNTTWYWYNLEPYTFKEKYFDFYFMEKRVIPFFERKLGRRIDCYPTKQVNLSVMPDNFYDASRKHVRELLLLLGADFTKRIVMDQPFAANNPQACFKFFDDPYAIVVDRDPRDNYVFSRTRLLTKNHFMPTENVEDFVIYYRKIRDNQPYKMPNERILLLQFEDLIYKYDKTTKLIRDFLKLPENPKPKTIFDPSLSIANTQVWKRFPQYEKDIKYIEEHLPEYLYDFSGLDTPDPNSKMFFGKSPLHK